MEYSIIFGNQNSNFSKINLIEEITSITSEIWKN